MGRPFNLAVADDGADSVGVWCVTNHREVMDGNSSGGRACGTGRNGGFLPPPADVRWICGWDVPSTLLLLMTVPTRLESGALPTTWRRWVAVAAVVERVNRCDVGRNGGFLPAFATHSHTLAIHL
jgi:hypothetical protein